MDEHFEDIKEICGSIKESVDIISQMRPEEYNKDRIAEAIVCLEYDINFVKDLIDIYYGHDKKAKRPSDLS